MKKNTTHLLSTTALALICLALMLSACSGKESGPTASTPASEATAQPTAPSTDDDSQEQNSKDAKLPEYLPSDFPLPSDAVIGTSQSSQNDGKKAALLILTSEQDMDSIVKLYKDYFEGLQISMDSQFVDERNIILQCEDEARGHSWSIIGGKTAASDDKIIELTITWSEI
ncbi:hypothetical protein [Paenibacillus oryzae]|nr:hypothetical protein [Paenibacillus oryzae]